MPAGAASARRRCRRKTLNFSNLLLMRQIAPGLLHLRQISLLLHVRGASVVLLRLRQAVSLLSQVRQV
jgi:hypothetical protein